VSLDLSQISPTLALVVVGVLCGLDLLAGFVVSLREHTTTIDKLPAWLGSNIADHFLPTVALWIPQAMTPSGAVDSRALAALVFTAAITSAPKLVQDIVQKVGQMTGATPAPDEAPS